MLPVHIDLEAGGIDTQATYAVDGVEGGRNIAHEYVHGRFAIFVLQEDRYAFGSCMRDYFTHTTYKQIPRLSILALEVVVIAFCTRPDDEVGTKCSGEVNTALERLNSFATQRRIGIDECSQFVCWIGMKSSGEAVDIHLA